MRINETIFKPKNHMEMPWYVYDKMILTSFPLTLDNKRLFILTEYNEEYYPPIGIFSIAVTEEELDKYFIEVDEQ